MPLKPPFAGPCLALALLLSLGVLGCGGPSGECTGNVGSVPIVGELGGETKLLIGQASPENLARRAAMVLEYADGAAFIEVELILPADRGSTAISFGPEVQPGEPGSGFVSRFRFPRPDTSPGVREGVLTVRQVDPFHLEGNFEVEFEDASELRCTFDVTGENRHQDDQLPDDALFPTP
jgi:hypothetical protein